MGPTSDEINEFLRNAWLQRIWTYQEAVMANNAILVCGRSMISWDRFAMSIVFLSSLSYDRPIQIWLALVYNRQAVQEKLVGQICTRLDFTKHYIFCLLEGDSRFRRKCNIVGPYLA
jgi:hypothetical protein